MAVYLDIKQDIARTKMRSMWGCLIWAVILIFGPILFLTIKFYYDTEIKENTLVVSDSPNDVNKIKVIEKGEPFFFGPSSIRLKYRNEYLDTSISNDGKRLDESNIEITWNNENEAKIILYGEEQVPEVISFKATSNATPFNVEYIELGYIPTASKQDPYGDYAIQIRKSTYSKGSKQRYNFNAPVRIYYGQKNSDPSRYKEWDIRDLSMWDTFELYWNDDYVWIDVLGENSNGTTYVKDSIEIPFNE